MPMSFDIFSQPQGPSIDTSLFPRVSQAGYQTGQQLGTGLSQAIEGGIEGLKTGVSIADALSVTRARDVQTRQQEIELETLPQRRQEELERLQRENDLAALEAEVITSNKDLFLEAKRTELQAAASKNRTVIQDNKNQETIAQILQGGTPQDKLALINDSNLFGTLSKNKDLTERVVGSLVRDGLLTPDNAMQIIDFSKFYEAQERDRDDRQKEKDRALGSFNKNTNELLTSQGFGNVRNAFTDVPLNTLLRDGEIVEVPKSETTIAPDGSLRQLTLQEKAQGLGDAKKVLRYKDREVVVTDDFAGKFGPAKTDLRAIENPVDDGRSVLEKYEEERNNKAKTIEGTVGASAGVNAATGIGITPSDQKPKSKSRLESTMLDLRKRKTASPNSALLTGTDLGEPAEIPAARLSTVRIGDTEVTLPPEISSSPEIVKAVFLAPAVSNVESKGKKKALSPKGARGLMQVMPGTFNDVVKRYNLKNKNIDNPRDNVEVGSLYLAEQIKAFGSEFGQGLELALAAYNTGPGRVADALRNAEEKTWEGVKVELDKMLKPSAYKEVSEYPDKVFRALLSVK